MPWLGFGKRRRAAPPPPPPPPPPPAYASRDEAAAAITVAQELRDLRLEVERDGIALGGQAAARLAAVVTDIKNNQLPAARQAAAQLRADVDAERLQIATLKQQYLRDKAALEAGDLARVPTLAPPGVGGPHAAVAQAKSGLAADPRTLAEVQAAAATLSTLTAAVRTYLYAETQQLAAARKRYEDGLAALRGGDAARFPAQPPAGLEDLHAAAAAAAGALPASPQSLADLVVAQAALDDWGGKVRAYVQAEARLAADEQRAYGERRARIESGALAALPARAPAGAESEHAAVVASRAAVPAAATTLPEVRAAQAALDALEERLAAYQKAEASLLAAAQQACADDRLAIENGDLKKLPQSAPPGLEALHEAAVRGHRGLGGPPATLDACAATQAALQKLKADVEAYLKAEALALAALLKKLQDDRKALDDGDLKKVPPAAPPGLQAEFDAIAQARAALVADPKTMDEAIAAAAALKAYEAKVADYLKAEAAALARAKKDYDDARQALEAGDLAKVPASAPAGLETQHAAVDAAKKALPADPKTIGDYQAATAKLADLKVQVAAYLKGAATKKNVEDGLAQFSSTGSKLSELTGHAKLNTRQKGLLDQYLKTNLERTDREYSPAELKQLAQDVADKVNQLAETRLESDIAGINDTLAASPTLKDHVVNLQAAGWTIRKGAAGGGSYCDKGNTTIVIDPNDSLEDAIGGLAHEAGHALYNPPAQPDMSAVASGAEYVKKCTEIDFIDEGEAQMVACRTTRELQAAGKTANVPADGGQFMAIYERFERNEITEEDARKEMATEFGNLVTSTTGEDYLTYYGKNHIANWNAAHGPTEQLDPTMLGTMTLFN